MTTIELDWTYEHFLTYVLFVVAYADLSIDSEELDEIKTIVKGSNTTEVEYYTIREAVLSQLELQNTVSQKEAFIKANKSHFLDSQRKKNISFLLSKM